MVAVKPHAVAVQAPSPSSSGGQDTSGSYASASTVRCQVTPLKASAAYEMYGREVRNPHLLLCDPGDAASFAIGAKVVWGARTFKVVSDPEVFSGIATADHASVYLEEYK